MLASSLFHDTALTKYLDIKRGDVEFSKIWKSLSPEDWTLIAEMEAITHKLASYAMCESQMDELTASKLPFFRNLLKKTANLDTFKVLDFSDGGTVLNENSHLSDMPRLDKEVTNFSDHGKKCFTRLKLQVQQRFGNLTPAECLPAFLDPVMKCYVSHFIPQEF